MISDYFKTQAMAERIQAGCVGPHMDGFIRALAEAGHTVHVIRSHIRTAVHICGWADRHGIEIASFDEDTLARFRRHLSRCGCNRNRGVFSHSIAATRRFLVYLRATKVAAAGKPAAPVVFAVSAERFATWMVRHRGVSAKTVHRYQLALRPFLVKLGLDPAKYEVSSVRSFVIDQLARLGRSETRVAVTAIRAFLRFLVAEGRVTAGVEQCVPTVPQWRLASLPRYLEAPDVERVVNSCDLSNGHGLRDHAVLLLLARLGLRAGDVVGMTVRDVDWQRGTLLVRGKGRREVLLPLPQDVGEAVLAYMERGRQKFVGERLFLTVRAPVRPFASSATVSDIVRFALKRAGIDNPPSRGAHLLRHSAATAMLRAGGTLDTIAMVLRHQSSQTTAYYAKVDVAMLQQLTQPWPGRGTC